MTASREFIPAKEAQSPFFVGVDLGGTNMKVGVVDDLGRSLSWLSTRTESQRGPEDAVGRMADAVRQAIREAGLTPDAIAYAGLGSPGTMDISAGMLLEPVNLKGWNHFPIRDRLSDQCGLPVAFANDAGAAAFGEFWVGSGRNLASIVLFTLGTGIGSGIIVGGVSIDGEHSHGAECGHMIIDYSDGARMCGCGRAGHLEAYASATAVTKRIQEALDAGRETSLSQRLAEGARLSPKLLDKEAAAGDALAMEIVMDTARYMGIGVVNLMHTIDPAGILLGGAMTFGGNETELGRMFLDRIREEVRQRAFPLLAERTAIEFASLGGDAGYIGAAGIARHEYLTKRTTRDAPNQ